MTVQALCERIQKQLNDRLQALQNGELPPVFTDDFPEVKERAMLKDANESLKAIIDRKDASAHDLVGILEVNAFLCNFIKAYITRYRRRSDRWGDIYSSTNSNVSSDGALMRQLSLIGIKVESQGPIDR